MMLDALPFREVWAADFEFHLNGNPGNPQVPVCMVAKELRSGRVIRHWRDELLDMDRPPFDQDGDVLYVAYLASAELRCHLALDWPLPVNVLDCFAEFRVLTNGLPLPRGRGLLGALLWFGLSSIEAEEKTHWRDLILTGGPWSQSDRAGILAYCATDVVALGKLLPRLIRALQTRPHWLAHALLRGRYMRSVAAMEYRGIPIDRGTLNRLVDRWESLKVAEIALNPDGFSGRTDMQILSTLVHEMAHAWQAQYGNPSRGSYHNREWADKMETVGLMASQDGQPGGKRTGNSMTHYIIEGGRFETVAVEFLSRHKLTWQATPKTSKPKAKNKTRYTCPGCGANAWAKPRIHIVCGDCSVRMNET